MERSRSERPPPRTLRDAAGVRLKDWIGINDWSVDTGGFRNNVAAQDLGGLLFSTPGQSHKCAIWRGLHLAHRDFRDLMGFNPPSGGLLIQADAPGETPLTMNTEIWWTPGYVTGYSGGGDDTITRHEFGHVIRHGYDGDGGHFLGDVVEHQYARSHHPCLRSGSLGYAFNEGWSEYWAREYGDPPMCAGIPADDYTVEGNVAAALADLEARCYGGNRAAMVNVLRSNPNVIHSFQQFRDRVFCPIPLLLAPLPPPPAPPATVALTPAQRAALARAQVREINGQLGGLRGDLRVADRAAAKSLKCTRTPCDAALRRALLPAVLRSEIALSELVRNAVDDGDTAKEQEALAKLPYKQLLALQKAKERSTRIQAARISADGIRDALKAGRPIFAKDKSAKTKRLRAQLASRMAAFRKVQRGATGAPGLILDQAIVERLRKVPARSFPNPEPPPPPWTPIPIPPTPPPPPGLQVSTLTLTCLPNTKPGTYVIGGTLTPALAGAGIELHVTPPNGPTSIQKLTTNGSGNYTTSLQMTAGPWTMFARFAGDAKTQPDDSPTCQTTIT